MLFELVLLGTTLIWLIIAALAGTAVSVGIAKFVQAQALMQYKAQASLLSQGSVAPSVPYVEPLAEETGLVITQKNPSFVANTNVSYVSLSIRPKRVVIHPGQTFVSPSQPALVSQATSLSQPVFTSLNTQMVHQVFAVAQTPISVAPVTPTNYINSVDCCPSFTIMNNPNPGVGRSIDWSNLHMATVKAILYSVPLTFAKAIQTFKMELVPAVNYMTPAEKDRWRGLINVD
jgi:hypothetical protein